MMEINFMCLVITMEMTARRTIKTVPSKVGSLYDTGSRLKETHLVYGPLLRNRMGTIGFHLKQ